METLPAEMVEMIVQQLTPQDLARCSAVCREWHEIFNQDWVWKPLCDPKLEEPLRTIPCVATPAFVAPEVENTTLSPISCWKLAFMRENHLWKNWRRKEHKVHLSCTKYKVDNVIKFKTGDPIDVDFLTDTLVVVWYPNSIEIFDVTVKPVTFVAKSSESVEIDVSNFFCRVIGPTMLVVVKKCSIEVFIVDIMNKSINLKHIIHLDHGVNGIIETHLVRDHFAFVALRRSIKIFDLSTGRVLKEEKLPVKVNQNDTDTRLYNTSSQTSDYVVVAFQFIKNSSSYYKHYIYSLKELTFLPDPVTDWPEIRDNKVSLLGHWVALTDYESKTLTVYNFITREVLLNYKVNSEVESIEQICVCGTSFVFWGYKEGKSRVKSYSPLDKTLTTLYENSARKGFKEFNNTFLAIFDDGGGNVSKNVLKFSGQTVEKCDISVYYLNCKVNRSFTRGLTEEYVTGPENYSWVRTLCSNWYIRWVW